MLVAIHRGPDLPYSGMADPHLWVSRSPSRPPTRTGDNGKGDRQRRCVRPLNGFYIGESCDLLTSTTQWVRSETARDLGDGSSLPTGPYAGQRNMPASGSCDHGQSWLLGESGLRGRYLMRATTHQHSLPGPCPSSTQLPHQPSVRSSDPRMHQCRVITFSGGSRNRNDPGTAASDTAVNTFAHSVGAAVTVPVRGLQGGALRCATP